MAVKVGYVQTAEHVRRRTAARLATLATRPKPVSKGWLEARYLGEQLDCVQIGALLERDPKTIWSWLRHYGIPIRGRGTHGRQPRGRAPGFRLTAETRAKLSAIAKRDGRVPYDPSVGPYPRGRRGAAATNWKGGVTPERQAFYASDEWKQACKAVWARANAQCERCGCHHNSPATRGTFHVHHIVSFAVRAVRADPTNLALLCAPCHRFVHSKANTQSEFLGEANKWR